MEIRQAAGLDPKLVVEGAASWTILECRLIARLFRRWAGELEARASALEFQRQQLHGRRRLADSDPEQN